MHEQLEQIISSYPRQREALIPILQKVQEDLGYLSEEVVSEVAYFLGVPESEVYGVASFYAQFRFIRRGEHMIKICQGTACYIRGGQQILETVERELDIQSGTTTSDYKFSLERVACLGCCALAPVMVSDKVVSGRMTMTKVKEILSEYSREGASSE